MKQLPVGVQDFAELRKMDKYYVDKSMLIGQILSQNSNGVYSITRPRRFGKSLNLSMLDAFFNIEYKGNTWFDGLEISKHPEYDSYKNAFPVIYLDLRGINFESMRTFFLNMNDAVFRAYRKHLYLRESGTLTEDEEKIFSDLTNRKVIPQILERSIGILSKALERYYGSKTVILIDEYDSIVNNVEDCELRQEIVDFIRKMLSCAFKGNNSLQLGVMTGITQVMLSDDFGGLNNVIRDDILNTDFGEMYGFTENEVKQICADYGHPEKFEEAKEWYGGYCFNESEVCNPWSILNYVQKNFRTGSYWAETGGNVEIYDIISNADDELAENLRTLRSGGTVTEEVDTLVTSDGYINVYSLMAVTGYLRAIPKGQLYKLSIPNRELRSVFSYGESSGNTE